MKISGYLISISILLSLQVAQAQQVVIGTDSVKADFKPTAIRIGTDAISLIQNFTKDNFTEYNFSVDVDFYRYFFNVEYGQLEQTLFSSADNATYTVDGRYFRFGPEVNFLKKDPEQNALFLGFRYATSKFSDNLNFQVENGFFGDVNQTVSNRDINANWFELVGGLKVKIWNNIWFGYTARFKFGANDFETNELIPNIIPGYGLAEETVAWDFNYWIAYRIPFRKQPEPLIQIGN